MSIDKTRVFNTDEINKLSTATQKLMDTADTVCTEIYNELGDLAVTINALPYGVKDSGLMQQVYTLKGKIKTHEFKQYGAKIKKALSQLNSKISTGDKRNGTDIANLTIDIETITSQIKSLTNLIPKGADSGTYQDFKKEFDSCVGAWEALKKMTNDSRQMLIEAILGSENDGVEKSKDPVNLSTGNFIYEKEDMQTAGEPELVLKRFYNALDSSEGAMGNGWRHSYEIHLDVQPEQITAFLPDGKKIHYEVKKNHTYYSDATRNRLLKMDNGFSLHLPDGSRYLFDKDGVCCCYENSRGKRILFTVENGKVKKILRQNDGLYYEFFYQDNGCLSAVQDQEGRKVTYEYAEEGKLSKASRLTGGCYTYTYDENGYIKSVASADGTETVSNEFDEEGRCVLQRFPDGSSMSFSYDEENSCVILTERNGSVIRYYHDKFLHNVRTVYEDGEERFLYNRKGQCTYYKNQNGAVTRYAYDPRGNVTQVIDVLGNKTNATYDARNHLVSLKVNGRTKIHNEYNAKGELVKTTEADGAESMLEYDEEGNPSVLILPDRSRISLSFDEKGNLTGITDASGAVNQYEYDVLNRVKAVTDGNGNTTCYEYNQSGDITLVQNPCGNQRRYCYNERGRVVQVTDFDGYRVQIFYSSLNKPERFIDKEGNETLFTYDSMWNLASQTAPDGGKTRFIYNKANRLEQVEISNGGTITYEYDAVGNRIAATDAEGNRTTFTYDAMNRVTEVIEADGVKNSYKYDEEGNLVSVTDALGNVRNFSYDAVGRRISETDLLGNTTKYTYTLLGNIRDITFPNGSKTVYEYEAGGRLKSITQPTGASVRYQYDNNGNVTSKANNLGQVLEYEYDSLNRMTTAKSPNGGVKRYEYDAVGNVTKIIDENGNATEYSYSPNGNLICVTDAMGFETKYEYDCMGQLVKIDRIGDAAKGADNKEEISNLSVMPEHQVTTYKWNLSGAITQITNPLGIAESYQYDKNGNLVEKADGDGYVTKYSYNQSGSLTDILYADGKSVKYSYNALRQLEEVEDWLGKTKIKLDSMGRPLSVTDFRGRTVSYEWGSMGEKTKLVYPDGKEAEYTYNQALQLTDLKGMESGKKVTYEYDSLGRLTQKNLPNGIWTAYQYNNIGRLERIEHTGKDGVIQSYRYAYDRAGNKTRIEKERADLPEDGGIFSYQYDVLNRLIRVSKNGQLLRSYQYDPYGNRTQKQESTDGAENRIVYWYNGANQLIKTVDSSIEKSYQYDGRGNLSRIMSGTEILQSYLFNAAGQMEQAETFHGKSAALAKYSYNGLGKRTGQEIYQPDETGGMNPMKDIQYTLDLTRQYYDLLGIEDSVTGKKQDFFWDGNVAGMSENGRDSYYLQDDLGSVMNLLDADGGSRETFAFDEFGLPVVHRVDGNVNEWKESGNGEDSLLTGFEGMLQPFAFTGYQPDETTGLYYAQARRYDVSVGRFVSEDIIKGFTILPSTLNEYNYCISNPLIYVDEDGQFWHIVAAVAIGGAIGGVGSIASDVFSGRKIDWKKAGKNTVKGMIAGGAIATGVGAVSTLATVAGTSTTTAVAGYVTTTAINATVSGVSNCMFNEGDTYSNFVNGATGGIVSNTVAYTGGMFLKGKKISGATHIANGLGGYAGSITTDICNSWDSGNQKPLNKMNRDAFISALVTGFMGFHGQNYLTPFDNGYGIGTVENLILAHTYGVYSLGGTTMTYAISCICDSINSTDNC